jgi:succinoglycan biosynthesis transport protein ExoP
VNLHDFIRLLHRRWRLVALFLLVWLGAAVALTALSPRIYEAKVEVFVSLRDSSSSAATNAYQGDLFSQQRVKSYAQIASAPVVTQPVIEKLGLDTTPDALAGEISTEVPNETVLVDIAVRDRSPAQARDLANATATQFAKVVGDLERPSADQQSPVSVTVVRPATVPTSPVSPRPVVNIALGILLGLATGLGAAALRDSLDSTVKDSEDLQALTGSAALGVVAFDSHAGSRPLISGSDPTGGRGEAFRTLRTNLRFVDVDHPPRAVVITSSVANEGKSTTACNLALTLASAGVGVILVEGDLRRPRVADYMGLEGAAGLTDVLIGRAALDDVLQPWGRSSLAVLPSGPLPPNPSELLGSAQMTDLLTALRTRAEVVIVDAPPLLPVTDAAVLARGCDGAIIVVRHGKVTREQVTRAVDALTTIGARVLGTVLNMVPAGGPMSYGYGYGSDYASRTDKPQLSDADSPPMRTPPPTRAASRAARARTRV